MSLEQPDAGLGGRSIELHWKALRDGVQASGLAPLSARQALHAAVLIDRMSEIVFRRRHALARPELAIASDVLAFRAALRICEKSLGEIMDLTDCTAHGPYLDVRSTSVADDEFAALPVADLMVSLYNDGEVPRLMLVHRQGDMMPMQHILQMASDWWATALKF
jgi:hypothetical protein